MRDVCLPNAETWVVEDGMKPVGFVGVLQSAVLAGAIYQLLVLALK